MAKKEKKVKGVEELLALMQDVASGDTHIHKDGMVHDDYAVFKSTGELPPEHDTSLTESETGKLARQLLSAGGVIGEARREFDNYRIPILPRADKVLTPEQVEAIHLLEDILAGGSPDLVDALRAKLKEGGFE